jgi:hypothetical protein
MNARTSMVIPIARARELLQNVEINECFFQRSEMAGPLRSAILIWDATIQVKAVDDVEGEEEVFGRVGRPEGAWDVFTEASAIAG